MTDKPKLNKQGVRDLNVGVNGKRKGEVIVQHTCVFDIPVVCGSCALGDGYRCGCSLRCSICGKGSR